MTARHMSDVFIGPPACLSAVVCIAYIVCGFRGHRCTGTIIKT